MSMDYDNENEENVLLPVLEDINKNLEAIVGCLRDMVTLQQEE